MCRIPMETTSLNHLAGIPIKRQWHSYCFPSRSFRQHFHKPIIDDFYRPPFKRHEVCRGPHKRCNETSVTPLAACCATRNKLLFDGID